VLCRVSSTTKIILTNADIIFRLNNNTLNTIENAEETNFFIGHRWDINHLRELQSFNEDAAAVSSQIEGSYSAPGMNHSGLDFFCASRKLFQEALDLISPSLTLGMPWWDLLLPIALQAAGGRLHCLDPKQFLHVRHEDRSWEYGWYNRIGARAVTHLQEEIGYRGESSPAWEWLKETEAAYNSHKLPLKRLRELKVRIGLYRRGMWQEPMNGWLAEVQNITLSHTRLAHVTS